MTSTFAGVFYRSRPYRLTLRGAWPHEPALIFPSLAADDPAQAAAVIDGGFLLGDRRFPFGSMPWSALPPGMVLAERMHAFGWLVDLRAQGSDAARARARALTHGWLAAHRRWTSPAWEPWVLARRLVNWLAAWDFLVAGAEPGFRQAFLDSAATQARHLQRVAGERRGEIEAISIAAGRIAAALALDVGDLGRAIGALHTELTAQVLPDGGHVSRNPAVSLMVLRDLIDVRAALMKLGKSPPPAMVGCIERMAPIVRGFRHGDGGLALFQGAKEMPRGLIDTILVAANVKERAPVGMPDSRYTRLAAGRTLLIADVGAPPPGPDGHAGLLAFEMSDGRDRLIVNCGAFAGDDFRWRQALRSTAAHSTLAVDEINAAEVSLGGWRRARRPSVTAERRETDGAIWLDASHDGYRRRFGLVHRRRLYLDATGCDIRGEDALEGKGGRQFRIRFHLHPTVEATQADDDRSVTLQTPSGGWRFVAVGGAIQLEESAYLGQSDKPQPSQQIIVSGAAGGGAQVKWALRRLGAAG